MSSAGTLPATATSQRLMKSEATEATAGFRPAAIRRSTPRRYASAAATYCSREKSSVTLTGTPAKIASSMAGSPSAVPGILMKRLGLPARLWRSTAAARVLFVSWARSGETSSDTQPSTPSVRAKTGWNRSAARVRSASASGKNRSSPDLAADADRRIVLVVHGAVLDRIVEDRRVRREPRHRELVDVALQRAAVQQLAGDVVEPQALAEIVELLGRLSSCHLRAGCEGRRRRAAGRAKS